MNRFVAIAVVVVAMPFVVGLARASFGPEPAAVVQLPHELTAVADAAALPRKYGLAVVPMPEVPSADGRLADDRLADDRSVDSRLADPRVADPRSLVCPDIRALVSGDSPFAVIAWGDTSQVVKAAQKVTAPSGEVVVRRITSKSISFAQADTTLQCKLLVR